MAENEQESQEQEVDPEAAIMAELEKLKGELMGEPSEEPVEDATEETPAEAPVETTVEAPAEPVRSKEDDDAALDEAAVMHLARMGRDKAAELLSKKLGYDLTPKERREAEDQALAKGTQRQTATQMLEGVMRSVPPEMLPDDFDDLTPDEKAIVISEIRSEMKAEEKAKAAIEPLMQAQAQAQQKAMLDATAQDWATQLGVPDAAQDIRKFFDGFSQDEIALYQRQAEAGGGKFVELVTNGAKQIADSVQKTKDAVQQQPIPAAEDAGGQTKVEEAKLSDHAQTMYEQMKASGRLSKEELAAARKELSTI